MASWLWWVHNAAPDLSVTDKVDLAEYLVAASLVELVYGEKWDKRWVIGLLAIRPRTGEQARRAYSEAVQRGLIPAPPSETEFRAGRLLGVVLSRDPEVPSRASASVQ